MATPKKKTVEELLEENRALSEQRSKILERQRAIRDEIETLAGEAEDRRRAEAATFGQTNRPRTQSVFGESEGS